MGWGGDRIREAKSPIIAGEWQRKETRNRRTQKRRSASLLCLCVGRVGHTRHVHPVGGHHGHRRDGEDRVGRMPPVIVDHHGRKPVRTLTRTQLVSYNIKSWPSDVSHSKAAPIIFGHMASTFAHLGRAVKLVAVAAFRLQLTFYQQLEPWVLIGLSPSFRAPRLQNHSLL